VIEALDAFLLFHGRKEDVLDLVELKIGIAVQGDDLVLLVELDLGRCSLEVVAVVDLAAATSMAFFNATMSASDVKSKLGME
jgi:hypothetical protein